MTDEEEPKSIWGAFIFGLAIFIVLFGILGLLTPANSQPRCADMGKVGDFIIAMNAEPEERSKEWFEEFKQTFISLGFNAEWPYDGIEKVMVLTSNTASIAVIGVFRNGCLNEDAFYMSREVFDQVVLVMDRNRT